MHNSSLPYTYSLVPVRCGSKYACIYRNRCDCLSLDSNMFAVTSEVNKVCGFASALAVSDPERNNATHVLSQLRRAIHHEASFCDCVDVFGGSRIG